jgi:hypothetical protein
MTNIYFDLVSNYISMGLALVILTGIALTLNEIRS